jgi:hypothetical protein
MRTALAFVVLVIALSQLNVDAARSQSSTQMVQARELLAWCSDGSATGSAACTAYIMGIADAVAHPSAASCPGSYAKPNSRSGYATPRSLPSP